MRFKQAHRPAAKPNSQTTDFQSLVDTTASVDRACRRLGFPPVLLRQTSGDELICVPALVSNCVSLLELLDVADPQYWQILAPEEPSSESTRTQKVETQQDDRGSGNGAKRRGKTWKRLLFNRSSSSKSSKTADRKPTQYRSEDTERSFRQLLTGIRRSSERLGWMAGLALDKGDSWPPSQLTELQQEVLFFQTRWPQMVEDIANKLSVADGTAKRLREAAAVKERSEAAARVRSAARTANLEAELRRVRAELRRCSRAGMAPQERGPRKQRQQQPRELQQQQLQKQTQVSDQQPSTLVQTRSQSPSPTSDVREASASIVQSSAAFQLQTQPNNAKHFLVSGMQGDTP